MEKKSASHMIQGRQMSGERQLVIQLLPRSRPQEQVPASKANISRRFEINRPPGFEPAPTSPPHKQEHHLAENFLRATNQGEVADTFIHISSKYFMFMLSFPFPLGEFLKVVDHKTFLFGFQGFNFSTAFLFSATNTLPKGQL